jgi:membrane-associated phospholipid phosphatase
MQSQLAQVKKNIEDITTEKRSAVLRWSGGAGTNTAAGQWLALSDSYMKKTNVSDLENALRVRAAIALSIADLLIVAHDSKYTYWSPRPQMIDSSIRTIVPTPNHPSYPSTSAAIGAAGATILSHYFPENANEWNGIADEIGQSRLWAGIHFKIDVDQGQVLGKRVANAVLASPRIQ